MQFCGRWATSLLLPYPYEKKRERDLLTKDLWGMKGATFFFDRVYLPSLCFDFAESAALFPNKRVLNL